MEDYLIHYGVLGMKWGVRRYQNKDGSLTPAGRRKYGSGEYLNAKKEYKAANKQYNKAFNKVVMLPGYGNFGITKKGKARNERLWNDVYDTARKADEAKDRYKIQKAKDKAIARAEKQKLRDKARELRSNGSVNKFVYNYKTAESAAKKILDNGMSVKEATSKAKKEAWRNTAIFAGAYAAVTVAQIAIMKKNGIL